MTLEVLVDQKDIPFAGTQAHPQTGEKFDVVFGDYIEGTGWFYTKSSGEYVGPFPTAEGAYLAAIGD